MLLLKPVILNFLSWTNVIVIGIIIGSVGQMGDLIESLIKRDANVKDSSNLIPGHGGIFDRFDSILFTAPVVLLYLKLFL
jgi:phosphatidate cytidylyltransferase